MLVEASEPHPLIFTGSSVAGDGVAADSTSSRPWRYWLRHLKTWLVLTSCARATSDTDAPGLSVSSTICRRSSFDRNRRVRPSFNVTTVSAVETAPIHPPVGLSFSQREE